MEPVGVEIIAPSAGRTQKNSPLKRISIWSSRAIAFVVRTTSLRAYILCRGESSREIMHFRTLRSRMVKLS